MKLKGPSIVVIASFFTSGLLLFISTFLGLGSRANPALADAGYPTKRVVGALIFVGAALLLLAAKKWKLKSTAWNFAVIGLPIAIAGWGLYTVSVIITDPLALFPIPLGMGLTAAHCWTIIEVWREEKVTRMNVEAYKDERSP